MRVNANIADTVRLGDAVSFTTQHGAQLVDYGRGDGRPARVQWRIGASIAEKARASTVMPDGGFLYNLSLVERKIRISDAIRSIVRTRLGDAAVAHDTWAVRQTVKLREAIRASTSFKLQLFFETLIAERVRAFDRISPQYGTFLADRAASSDGFNALRRAVAAVAEMAQVETTIAPTLRLTILMDDAALISDAAATQMFFKAMLVDGAECHMDLSSPTGSLTQWAMNARSGGVTEYQGPAFNSYAKLGRRYLAANERGIYELDGDTDAGEPVKALLRSGIYEMTGPQLTGLQAAYVAIRGKGEFYLKVSDNAGMTTTFRVIPQPMKTARINLGKGWRARYISWELTTLGADFDFQGIEFLPVASKRRV